MRGHFRRGRGDPVFGGRAPPGPVSLRPSMPSRSHAFSVVALVAAMLVVGCGRSGAAPDRETEPAVDADTDFDVVVVGGGLAGLSAAYELLGKRVLLVEKEPRLGGRVHTKDEGDTRYELGAFFAYDPRSLPEGSVPSPRIAAKTRIGYSEARVTRFADSAQDLVDSLEGRSTGAARTTRNAAARRAFFGLAYPGGFDDYIYERQSDWRLTHELSRTEGGNGELVEALARSSGAQILLGAEVSGIEEDAEHVRVTYAADGETTVVTSLAAILATPADVATRLLGTLADEHPVSRVRYAPSVVAVLGVGETALEPFSYVVSEDAGLSAVLSRSEEGLRVLTAYFARDDYAAARALGDEALVEHTVERINALGVGTITTSDVRFSDVGRWETHGTIISSDPYARWEANDSRVSPRIFLAGDYTQWDEERMPYGMSAAVESGRRVANEVRALVSSAERGPGGGESPFVPISPREAVTLHTRLRLPVPAPSRLPPLTTCDLFELGEEAPRYLGRIEGGSVAPYGPLLLAEADEEITAHLLESSVDGLWEYGPGYGVTSIDSALVLEGLLAAGVDETVLVSSLDLIRDRYLDPASGGFVTMARGRVGRPSYWSEPSVDTTAMIGHLMQRVAPERFAAELSAAARYLLAEQTDDGLFEARWFPSWVLATSYAVRFLARRPDPSGEYRASIERATQALVELQRNDGSVSGSVSETALLAMTLAVTQNHPEALTAARAWLARQLDRGIPAGDGFSSYWLESADGARTFFSCKDRGRIAEAWARAALNDPPAPPPI
jgi:protoporphyrinogen oxidase